MRTPEETARLANGVAVTPDHPRSKIEVEARCGGLGVFGWPDYEVWLYDNWERRRHRLLANPARDAVLFLAADLAEARAEAKKLLEAETQRRCELGAAYHEEARRHADTESELAEARAEVAALREVASLVREWQAAKDIEHRADTDYRNSATPYIVFEDAKIARQAIEARLLAAVIPEVDRG
jgi:hypothetical protein